MRKAAARVALFIAYFWLAVTLLGARAQANQLPSNVWCSDAASGVPARQQGARPVNTEQRTFVSAWTALCAGKFATARGEFTSIISYRVWFSDDSWGIDTQRGYFYSLIASRDYTKARNYLTRIEAEQTPKWQAGVANRLFWSGKTRAAYAEYAKEAGGVDVTPDSGRDRNIDDAAAAMENGDTNAAIEFLSKPSGATGASTVDSLQRLMLGNAYETQRHWRDAFATWVRAADDGHAVMEYDFLDDWNLSAMEMIYYYRAHLPR